MAEYTIYRDSAASPKPRQGMHKLLIEIDGHSSEIHFDIIDNVCSYAETEIKRLMWDIYKEHFKRMWPTEAPEKANE